MFIPLENIPVSISEDEANMLYEKALTFISNVGDIRKCRKVFFEKEIASDNDTYKLYAATVTGLIVELPFKHKGQESFAPTGI